MERVLKHTSFNSLVLLFCLVCAAQPALATTAILPPDTDMIVGARAIVRGKVLSIESSFDQQQGRIYTYVTLKVQEVLKGQIFTRRIVIKELGGQIGEKISVVYGNPQFSCGEQVLVYLDTWKDGSLRTYQMFLGKFSVIKNNNTGREFAVRDSGGEHVVVLDSPTDAHGAITNRMELNAYTAMIRTELAANIERSQRFEDRYYANIPTLPAPPEYIRASAGGNIQPYFALMNPTARWWQPDTGQPVTYTINPHPSTEPGIPPLVVPAADVAAAAAAWSTVTGCALNITYAGQLDGCYTSLGTGGINVVGNNCDGRNAATPGCASILAWGGWSGGLYNPKVINGTSFQYQITQGFVSCNPWAACNFTDSCSVQFIVTHEMGHALGLGHSQFQQATMYGIAYAIARCAGLWTDDQDAIKFVYPSSGGGGGPLSITTSALPAGTVGASYGQSLSASGGTLPYTWSLVQGQGTLPPGLSLSAGGVITGTPTTAGTYNFTVRVTDNVAATAQRALGIVVSAAGGGGALNSQFVSQTVPTSLQPGQGFTVNMRFLNTGTQTWSGPEYYFASQNPPLNQTWGGNGVSLYGFTAAPGEQLDVNFTATAPTTPGTYNFQWQMYQNGGVGFFGQMSTNVVVSVGVQTNYQGFHDGAGCNTISGWAWDPSNPNSTVNVDIYDGNTLIGTAPANMYREDLLNALGSPSHGFSFLTPASLKDGAVHSINVKFSGTNTLLSNTARPIQSSAAPNLIGRHDGQGCNAIEGWAWDSNDSTGTVNVDIYDGTTLIGSTAATLYRQDLADVFGSPYHGFIFHPPASLKDGQPHTITVKFGGTNTNLPSSPRTFVCTSSTPNYQGNLDVADCNTISGYAWDANDDNTINVAIYVDGGFLVVVPAQQVYPGIGNGFHGFKFAVPASLKNGQPHLIQVKFSGTPTSLLNSSKTIVCP